MEAAGALAANYPFATIEPNVGVVAVPDGRLGVLNQFQPTEKIVPAALRVVDIAGIVRGASTGEGLGNKFLSHIREVDAILHALRTPELHGPTNLTAPHPVTNAEFTRTLAGVLHRPAVLPTPLLPLKALYGEELVEHLLLASQNVVPERLTASRFTFEHPTLEVALRAQLRRDDS